MAPRSWRSIISPFALVSGRPNIPVRTAEILPYESHLKSHLKPFLSGGNIMSDVIKLGIAF